MTYFKVAGTFGSLVEADFSESDDVGCGEKMSESGQDGLVDLVGKVRVHAESDPDLILLEHLQALNHVDLKEKNSP